MPVVRDPYDATSIVHSIFEMNLPEGALLERLRLLFAKIVPNLDSLGLVSIIGPSQVGRLRFARRGTPPIDVPEQSLKEVLAYAGIRDLFEDLFERFRLERTTGEKETAAAQKQHAGEHEVAGDEASCQCRSRKGRSRRLALRRSSSTRACPRPCRIACP